MSNHECEACIVTCIDYRLQQDIDRWIAGNFQPKTFDRIAFAGGVKNLDAILDQIGISERLHHIKKAVLINHEDCGAYGEAGSSYKHTADLRNACSKIKELYPELEVETYYLHLDGTFEVVK